MITPKPEPLVFPRGVRFARKNEMPNDGEEALARIAKANITTGYTLDSRGGNGFTSYFEANVHAPSIFEVFRDVAESIIIEVAAPIIGLKDEEPTFGPYTTREEALKVFEPHVDLLQNDGFLEFGVIFAFNEKIEEIFVKSSKYFQIWTNKPETVAEVLARNNIPPVENIQFIDEYAMVSRSLGEGGNAGWPGVIDTIENAFESLPKVNPPSS